MKKFSVILLIITVLFFSYVTFDALWFSTIQDTLELNEDSVTDTSEDTTVYDTSDYEEYIALHGGTTPSGEEITIEALDFLSATGDNQIFDYYEGETDVYLTNESSFVTWDFYNYVAGYYNVEIHYYPYEGKSSSIERAIYINGEIPFDGASNVTFYRIWGNQEPIAQDINGNDIRPSQVELPFWLSDTCNDSSGYTEDPYVFYFHQGVNTISLEGVREPMMIKSITIKSVDSIIDYETYKNLHDDASVVSDASVTIQTENLAYSTSPTLYPLNDRTSSVTYPSSPKLVKMNTIGGNNWRIAGDYIVWNFSVPEDGLYEISMRVKQRLATGMNVYRNIYIDNQIPFSEMENYAFVYDNNWRIQTLGNADTPYLFYLEAGEHTFKMEVSLGRYGSVIDEVQSSINALNKLYREILVYTGPEPDQYRDYQLTERIENLISRIEEQHTILSALREEIIDIAGTKSEKTGILDTVIVQLEDFLDKPREIHTQLATFNSNISSLGTLVILLSEQPLEIDYFLVHSSDTKLPLANASFIANLWYKIESFFATFNTDYSSLGETDDFETNTTVEVWLSIGRDQANVLRKMIDQSFTPNSKIKIDLKLVNSSTLLPATLSNVGPDVAMGLGNSIPVNYAMRSAVYDLTNFDDFYDIAASRFKESAMVPFEYEGGYYALPEQQIFLMMFYRTDIFEELGLEVPSTWDDVIRLIPDLQKHNLEFYLPVPITQGSVMNLPPNPIFSTLFYQNDGEFYTDGNTRSGFDLGRGPEVFEMWTQFYTDYSFPVQADFVNRFRSGQMPIGITYYNVYNTLSVFAPEIRGKWDFVLVPGTLDTNELGETYIRRDTVSTGTSVMIMNDASDKEAAWEFLKWWTSTPVQVQFGREMEGILGAAARYPTANVAAMAELPWTVTEYTKLEEQWDWVRGIPEVPGGYMTGRHLDNAFRKVYNELTNPRETLYDYVQIINAEIASKRKEFGLDTGGSNG
ncbi:MAG: extracellular solute-binding protein [Candidatus Izemoplasmatales bacterium]